MGGYLVDRHFLAPQDVVDGRVEIIDASRRNRNFLVHSDLAEPLFVKQGRPGNRSVRNEAEFLRKLSNQRHNVLQSGLPTCLSYDPEANVLVTRKFERATNLGDFIVERSMLSPTFARSIGQILRGVHDVQILPDALDGEKPRASRVPWVFLIHRPTAAGLSDISQANLELTKTIQSLPKVCEALDLATQLWMSNAIIHGDTKFDNFVVYGKTKEGPRRRLALIDWEMAKQGDPCWDLGCVFGELLRLWAAHNVSASRGGLQNANAKRQVTLHEVKNLTNAVWSGYTRFWAQDDPRHKDFLHKAALFSSIRLVQTCYEFLQFSNEVSHEAGQLLQLAINVITAPAQAAAQLLGLPLIESKKRVALP